MDSAKMENRASKRATALGATSLPVVNLRRSTSRCGPLKRRLPKTIYRATHYDSFEFLSSVRDATFCSESPILATALEAGGLVLFDLSTPDASVAAAPEHIGSITHLCFGPTNSFGDPTLYGACQDGFIRRWIVRDMKELLEIEAIPFEEEVNAIRISPAKRSVIVVGKVGLVLVASTLYAECARYVRLAWPVSEGASAQPQSGSSGHTRGSSSSRSSRSAAASTATVRPSIAIRLRSSEEREGPEGDASPRQTSTSAQTRFDDAVEVDDAVVLPDVLLHPRAPENADVFYMAVASRTHGLIVLNIIVSEPEFTHEFGVSWLMTRHLPGCFRRVAVTRAPLPEVMQRAQQQMMQQQQQQFGRDMLSMDSLTSVVMRGEVVAEVPLEDRQADAGSEYLLLSCLSPGNSMLTLIGLIPNVFEYPGCDMHATIVELTASGTHAGDGVLSFMGGLDADLAAAAAAEEEAAGEEEASSKGESITAQQCSLFKPLLCVGNHTSSVSVYELSYFASAADKQQQGQSFIYSGPSVEGRSEAAILRYRLRLVYHLDGNRGCPRVLTVPPSIVRGRRVMACSSGPYLLNLFEISKTLNPDVFALPQEEQGDPHHQAALDAQKHAAANIACIEYLKSAFTPTAADGHMSRDAPDMGAAPAGAAEGQWIPHHNKQQAFDWLLQPSLRTETAAAVAAAPVDDQTRRNNGLEARELRLQAETLSKQMDMITRGLKASNSIEHPQHDTRPPWNNRFNVKGSELDNV